MLEADRLQDSDLPEDSSSTLYFCPKLMKERSPLTMLTSCSLRSRLLHSLYLPGKKPSTPLHPEDSSPEPGGEPEEEHRLRDDTFDKSHLSKSSSGGGETCCEENGGSSSSLGDGEINGSRGRQPKELCCYERLAEDGPSGGGGVPFKSRSQSFNTDTTTSGISSMSSSPTRETLHPPSETKKTPLSIPKSCSAYLVPPGSAHTLPRRASSFRSPSVSALSSLTDCSLFCSSTSCCTSPRDALGYTTLRRLQHQRIQPSVSHSEARASPAKEILFTDAITMNSGSLDSRRTTQR